MSEKNDYGVIVPTKILNEFVKSLKPTDEKLKFCCNANQIMFYTDTFRMVSKLYKGDYIDYKRIIPKECKTRVLVNTADLYTMTDRAQLIAREGNNSVMLHFEGDSLTMSAESFVGRGEDTMEVSIVGDPIDIAFNPKYIINILKNITDETVYLEFNSPISPCVIRPVQGDAYLYLIVPMRVY
jgi:DNA polymerase-3 subunit beta